MKGLEIARAFFFEWGLPLLEREYPRLAGSIAAGRIFGSDVLGADDEISRDHTWGPTFTLFLSADDFDKDGDRLSTALNKAAPNPWRGYRLAGGEDKSVEVECIPKWFHRAFGLARLPGSDEEWRPLAAGRESHLYFLRHGALWMDGSGEFSAWRKGLARYPEKIRLYRISEECFRIWHYGEYNFVSRIARRMEDPLLITIGLGQFLEGVMTMVLLLQGDFAPYWKWLPHEFRKHEDATTLDPLMEALVRSRDIAEQAAMVQRICAYMHQRLVATGVIIGTVFHPDITPLLNAHRELEAKL